MIGGLETDAGESVTHRSWNIDCRSSRCVYALDSGALPPLNLRAKGSFFGTSNLCQPSACNVDLNFQQHQHRQQLLE
jgi:hypothetical protein